MTTQTETARGARVIFIPPPLYYVAGLGSAALDSFVRLRIGAGPVATVAGAALTVLGLTLAFAGVITVVKHRTTIVPHHRVATLVTGGPYRLSRNPMYTGLAIAYLGVALLIGSWWPVVLWPLVLFVVYRLVIRPEEGYLAQRFGPTYADYRSRVRRWL